MFALSRDKTEFFLYNPSTGMEVPVLLNLKDNTVIIKIPPVDDLESEYASYRNLKDIKNAVKEIDKKKIEYAKVLSQECSKLFRVQILGGKITIAQLRELINKNKEEIVEILNRIEPEIADLMLATPQSEPRDKSRRAKSTFEPVRQRGYFDPEPVTEPVAVVLTPPEEPASPNSTLAKRRRIRSFSGE